MDERNNYVVLGLDNYNAMRDRLAVLEDENTRLRIALDSAVASHQEIQERIAAEESPDD